MEKKYYGATCPFCGHMNNVKLDPAELPEAELATQCGVCKIVFPFSEEDLTKKTVRRRHRNRQKGE